MKHLMKRMFHENRDLLFIYQHIPLPGIGLDSADAQNAGDIGQGKIFLRKGYAFCFSQCFV